MLFQYGYFKNIYLNVVINILYYYFRFVCIDIVLKYVKYMYIFFFK